MAGLLYQVEHCIRNFCTWGLGSTPEESDTPLCRGCVTLQNLRNISDCTFKSLVWPLRLSALTPQHSSPCPCYQRLEGLGKGAWFMGLWVNPVPQSKSKPNKTPLFKQKVNNVNETWMDRKLWISLPAQPTSGSKLIHKCFGITKEEEDTHLQPRPSSFPVFLQPQQSRAGMLVQYRKWSALIYIRQCWCDLQITHTQLHVTG